MFYISSWRLYTEKASEIINEALDKGQIALNDTVWGGPSGDLVIGDNFTAEEEEEYADYVDRGTVEEYLNS